jgi:hypothetical protein
MAKMKTGVGIISSTREHSNRPTVSDNNWSELWASNNIISTVPLLQVLNSGRTLRKQFYLVSSCNVPFCRKQVTIKLLKTIKWCFFIPLHALKRSLNGFSTTNLFSLLATTSAQSCTCTLNGCLKSHQTTLTSQKMVTSEITTPKSSYSAFMTCC